MRGQRLRPVEARQRRMRAIQYHEIGLLAWHKPRHGAAARTHATSHGFEIQPVSHLCMRVGRQHVAPLQAEPLAVFEQAQLLGHADAGMAVGADAPCACCAR